MPEKYVTVKSAVSGKDIDEIKQALSQALGINEGSWNGNYVENVNGGGGAKYEIMICESPAVNGYRIYVSFKPASRAYIWAAFYYLSRYTVVLAFFGGIICFLDYYNVFHFFDFNLKKELFICYTAIFCYLVAVGEYLLRRVWGFDRNVIKRINSVIKQLNM